MKKITLYIALFVIFPFGLVMLLAGTLSIFGQDLEHTIEHSKVIERKFKVAANYVNNHKQKFGRLPTKQEFDVWTSSFPDEPYSSSSSSPKDIGIAIDTKHFPDEITRLCGQPPEDSYVLDYWRGEWFEYYASWVDKSTLEFDESKYYLFGNKYLAGASYILIALLSFVSWWLIWRKKSILLLKSTAA
jgi:hypothetical protein